MKDRLTTIQRLIPKYFSGDKYMELYNDIVRHNAIYKLSPTLEVLSEIINGIDPKRFELGDIRFLLNSYYHSLLLNNNEGIEWDNLEASWKMLPIRLLDRFKEVSTQTDLLPFFQDFDYLAGYGFLDDIESVYEESEEKTTKNFQYSTLHLNYSQEQEKWAIGNYILIISGKEAFELFEKGDEIYSFYHENYDEAVLRQILAKFPNTDIDKIKKHCSEVL